MKRQSIAETTLKKQIRNLDTQIDIANEEAERIGARIKTLHEIRDDLEAEVTRLEFARQLASASGRAK